MIDMGMAAVMNDPLGRLLKDDVALGSIFTQMYAAQIILAVQDGHLEAVKNDEGKYILKVTPEGKTFFAEKQAARIAARPPGQPKRPWLPGDPETTA